MNFEHDSHPKPQLQPQTASAPEQSGFSGRARRNQGALSVLVVEDNRDSAELMAVILEYEGCLVHTAFDGPAAISAARQLGPDVVLVDIGLPGMNGYELAAELLAMESLRNTALIAVTGYAGEEDRRHTRESGFSHHLVKPVDMDELRRILASVAAASGKVTGPRR